MGFVPSELMGFEHQEIGTLWDLMMICDFLWHDTGMILGWHWDDTGMITIELVLMKEKTQDASSMISFVSSMMFKELINAC